MTEAKTITSQEMRDLERRAIESGAVTGLELMERAGAGVVEAIFEEWPEYSEGGRTAFVLCGPGNNGGDGFVIARLLRERGWHVEVFLFGAIEKLPVDARTNAQRWTALGEIHSLSEEFFECLNRYFEKCRELKPDVMIDALFGIGLSRSLPHILTDILDDWSSEFDWDGFTRYLAVDIPSGLDADTGVLVGHEPEWFAPEVHLTITFHALKPGHKKGDGPDFCGKIVVKDIGL